MNRLSPLAAALAALVCLAATADRPEYAWGKTFEVEQLSDMVLDDDGNWYVALPWDKVIAGPRAVIKEIQFGLDGYLYIAGRFKETTCLNPPNRPP